MSNLFSSLLLLVFVVPYAPVTLLGLSCPVLAWGLAWPVWAWLGFACLYRSRLNINFSSRTTAADAQSNIEANVDKRSGAVYGPPSGKKLLVFIDDMNMPKVDNYGTQQPIALLFFLMSRGWLYDRGKDLNLKTIKDVQYIAAMGPPGGGRNPVDPRFVALFNVFNLTPPTQAVLVSITMSISMNMIFHLSSRG